MNLLSLPKSSARYWLALALIIVGTHALWPYWMAHQDQLGASLSWMVMTRWSGDASYLPLVRFMADGNFGENVLAHAQSPRGLMVFQFFSILPFALLFKLAGAWGIIAGDLLFHLFGFLSFVWLLRLVVRRFTLRLCLALAFKVGAFKALPALTGLVPPLAYCGWDVLGFRLPNPLISLPTLYVALVFSWLGFVCRRERAFVIWCYAMVILAQQNAYYTMQASALAMLLCLRDLKWSVWLRRWKAVRGHLIFLLLLAVPLIIQLAKGSQSMKDRLGFYKIAPVTGTLDKAVELLPGVIAETFGPRFSIILLIVGVLLLRWQNRRVALRRRRLLLFAPALALSGYLAMPLLSLAGHFSLHAYHFSAHRAHMEGLAIILVTLLLLQDLAASSPRWLAWCRRRCAAAALTARQAVLGCTLAAIAALGAWYSFAKFKLDDQRLQQWGYEGAGYNRSFAELIGWLEKDGLDHWKGVTLVSPDFHVLHYWTLFGPKTCFYPEPWATTIKDAELEQRFVEMLRLFGVTDHAQMDALLNDYFFIYLMSCNRFQATCVHHPEPLNKYTPEDKKLILNGAWWRSWQLALPSNARKIVLGRFDKATGPDPKVLGQHLVVLTKADKLKALHPPQGYSVIFENDNFIVSVKP